MSVLSWQVCLCTAEGPAAARLTGEQWWWGGGDGPGQAVGLDPEEKRRRPFGGGITG